MKKLIMLTVLFGLCVSSAFARVDRPIEVDELPAAAKEFISTHFAGSHISYAKVDPGLFGDNYDVIFADGTKLEFDNSGNWKSIDCKHSAVPNTIIPDAINSYIDRNFPQTRIVELDRDNRDYEIKLSNGMELKFDNNYRLIDIDD